MIRRIFLGPWVHWLIVAIMLGLGWFAGTDRLHVKDFNLFLIAVIGVTLAAVLIVLRTSPADRQVTRDPIEDPFGDDG